MVVEVVPGRSQHAHHQQDDQRRGAFAWQRYRNRAATLALLLSWCTQQVDPDHRSSKLLRANPTATANCAAFCSTRSAPGPTGGSIFWKGFSTSTGSENSCRKASIRPGTFDDPPAR